MREGKKEAPKGALTKVSSHVGAKAAGKASMLTLAEGSGTLTNEHALTPRPALSSFLAGPSRSHLAPPSATGLFCAALAGVG